ncbi:MAG: hypothetical protein Q9160_000233 [Pyrenula sp. 1 TL-2023]
MSFSQFPELPDTSANMYLRDVLVPGHPLYNIQYLYCPHNTNASNILPTLRDNDTLLEDWSRLPDGTEVTGIMRFDRCKRCDARRLKQSKATAILWATEEVKRLDKRVTGDKTNSMTDEERNEKGVDVLQMCTIHLSVLEDLFQKKWGVEDGISLVSKSSKLVRRKHRSKWLESMLQSLKLSGSVRHAGRQKMRANPSNTLDRPRLQPSLK